MTTMDSDSESQDSDDGRRFRFEATRKDHVQMELKAGRSSRSRSERNSCHNHTEPEGKKDKIKNDCNKGESRLSKERETDNRDSKHSTKYLKHPPDSRSYRREDNKDCRNVKDDASTNSKSSSLHSKHKARDVKGQRSRDRDEHRSDRPQERSRSRNENDRSQSDKHRNKSHEKYKYHTTNDKNRDRSCQSHKTRTTNHGKIRETAEKWNICKKLSTKEDTGQHLQESSTPKSIEQDKSSSNLLTKRDFSMESQENQDLNLSEFDILSETDENMSDSSTTKDDNSLTRHESRRTKKRNLDNEYENLSKKQVIEYEHMEGSLKVNARKNDVLHGSSHNNSGTISDSTLGTAPPTLMESGKNTVNLNSEDKHLNATAESTSLHQRDYGFAKVTDNVVSLSEIIIETKATYGPVLPPQITNASSTNAENEVHFIGPCLPKYNIASISDKVEKDTLNCIIQNNVTPEDAAVKSDTIFGPALPPHLLKHTHTNAMVTKIIGPTLPNTENTFNDIEVDQLESENEHDIGPLPVNHPALESNYIYKQLEERAQQIKNEQKDEACNILHPREEWMTELPPAQMSNLGLTSRKFRIRAGPDMSDRSCWTDTPAKKAEKQKQKEEEKLFNVRTSISKKSERSDESEPCESKISEISLLEMHQNKLRRKKMKAEKKAKASGQTLRRPFDRDIDLQISRFDQVQKNAIIHKAQHLDERFTRGKY